MVNGQQFLIVFSLFSISYAISTPSQRGVDRSSLINQHEKSTLSQARYPKFGGTRPIKRGPSVSIAGVDLDIHERASSSSGSGNKKRAVDVNGTEVNLGSTQNTFIIPVSIGSPPTTYPLQLDLASSDLFLASTLCSSTSCPESLGPNVNAYYDITKSSSGFQEVNANQSYWNSSYADGTIASGFVVREKVTLGEVVLEGQIMGLINSTNLTLEEQKISGILGLGFPRLSTLSHILLDTEHQETSSFPTSNSSSANGSNSNSSTSTSAISSSPTYFPPVLENIVRTPHIPYPVFALALAPPPKPPNTTSTSSATPSSTARFQHKIGSLTLGGVSNHYISNKTGSGRTIDDIEWHEVVPFGKARSASNDSVEVLSRTNTGSATPTFGLSTSASISSPASSIPTTSSTSTRRRRSDSNQLDSLPHNLNELSEEEYLFWTISLSKISLNGTVITLNSSYENIGLNSLALLDIGFNGISGPQQDVTKIFDGIKDARLVGEGRWVVPCDTEMTLGFSFGGRYVQLQPSDWISTQIDGSSFCLAWPIAAPSTGDGLDWQLGTPFLKKVYSIFSYGINGVQAPLVGFLPLEDDPALSPSAPSPPNTNITTFDPNSPTPTTISSISLTTTLKTVLPNNLIPDPTFTTPTYVYQTTPTLLPPGITQYMGLANSSAYTIGQVPIISLDGAATSRIASMAGGGMGGDNGMSSGAVRGVGVGIFGIAVGILGILFNLF